MRYRSMLPGFLCQSRFHSQGMKSTAIGLDGIYPASRNQIPREGQQRCARPIPRMGRFFGIQDADERASQVTAEYPVQDVTFAIVPPGTLALVGKSYAPLPGQ